MKTNDKGYAANVAPKTYTSVQTPIRSGAFEIRKYPFDDEKSESLTFAEEIIPIEAYDDEHKCVDSASESTSEAIWPEPRSIAESLLPVAPFQPDLLPASIRAWVDDIAERMQCPLDFTAVAAMVCLSAVIGRKVCIQPKRKDDWTVIPNLWGAVVGRPGVMKSPALSEAMKPLKKLAHKESERHAEAMLEYGTAKAIQELSAKNAQSAAQKLVKNGKVHEAERLVRDALKGDSELKAPAKRRHIVTDSSMEALGEILIENPWGVLAYRDELNGLLRSLDKEGQESARAFYLQSYDGNQSYDFHRIGRGKDLYIPAVCISMLGGIQPGKLKAYINDAVDGGAGDDGLLQRFGLLVWPEISKEWVNVDEWPDSAAKNLAMTVFERLDTLEPDIDPESGQLKPKLHRFSEEAQDIYDSWRCEFEVRLRSGDHHPAFESHLSKYRKLVPAIALVCSLADGETEIEVDSLLKALAWVEYLETHAARIYAAGTMPSTDAAKALLKRIKDGSVKDAFKASDIYLKGWSNLSTPENAHSAIRMLADLEYIFPIDEPRRNQGGGRPPSPKYRINPRVLED